MWMIYNFYLLPFLGHLIVSSVLAITIKAVMNICVEKKKDQANDLNRHFCSGNIVIAKSVKNLPAMQETQVRFLGWGDPLEKGMAIHSRILAWRIPWTEEPGRLQSMGSQELDTA